MANSQASVAGENLAGEDHEAAKSAPDGSGVTAVAQSLMSGARDAFETVSAETERFGLHAKAEASRLAAVQINGVAASLHDVADGLRGAFEESGQHPNIAAIKNSLADRVDLAATAIGRKTPQELYLEVETLCRRYPVGAAAGGAILGVLISAALKRAETGN